MAHLHENHWITPVKMEVIDGDSPRYLGLWGIGGVALGSVLPWLDSWWEGSDDASKQSSRGPQGLQHGDPRSSSRWSSSVRSIGAFVGIAFAMVSINLLPDSANNARCLLGAFQRLTPILLIEETTVGINGPSIANARAR